MPDSVPATTIDAATETPVDFVTPQLTWKSAITGMVLGGVLCVCNIYTGLKIGWGLNMSITGILLAFAFWYAVGKATGGRVKNINKLENNVNQSAVSAAGAVSSAGLVSAIPALTMVTGQTLPWWQLFLWISTVCFVGIAVAMGLRTQMIIRDKLPFPGGLSCAETLKEVYNTGSEALKRVGILGLAALVGGGVKLMEILNKSLLLDPAKKGEPITVHPAFQAVLRRFNKTDFGMKINGSPAADYGVALDPALVMVAVGGLVGFRACWSLILGSFLAFIVIGTQLVGHGVVTGPDKVKDWVLWPGVTLMVIASLVSFSFSMPSIIRSFRRTPSADGAEPIPTGDTGEVSRRWFYTSLIVALILCVILQTWFFGISWWAAIIAVLLSFVLAVVATRVSGETNVNPVGPMGKVTQLTFAGIEAGNPTANLMAASVTSGAASQCSDLMHDLKCGYLLGNIARHQVVGQFLGSIVGAAVASYFYLILIPDPANQLITKEWPAPAVATWKAVADLFAKGIDSLPAYVPMAIAIAAVLGVVLPLLEKFFPKAKTYIPSPAALGLAFVIQPNSSISMFIGGCIALVLAKVASKWTEKYLVTVCAGIIAGESLVGAGDAIRLAADGLAELPDAPPVAPVPSAAP